LQPQEGAKEPASNPESKETDSTAGHAAPLMIKDHDDATPENDKSMKEAEKASMKEAEKASMKEEENASLKETEKSMPEKEQVDNEFAAETFETEGLSSQQKKGEQHRRLHMYRLLPHKSLPNLCFVFKLKVLCLTMQETCDFTCTK
jgi:flagellar biosynthesis GTPase FlhF